MSADVLPLIADYDPQRVFAWREGQPVTCGRALGDMQALAQRLARDTPYINRCEDRYLFTVALAAVALARGVNLLPQSRADGSQDAVRRHYPDTLVIGDDQVVQALAAMPLAAAAERSPTLAASRRVAVVFTSGSTGQPSQHSKYWRDLVVCSDLYRQRFFADGQRPHTVATVPAQHMYGLETSVLPALHLGFAAAAERPFMPWAVAEALARLPAPRVLITTPVHLRACLEAGVTMPDILRVISATAPLDAPLARAVESAWRTEVHEIYGSTETGSVASRRPVESDIWTLYDGMSLSQHEGAWVQGAQLPAPVRLSDDLDEVDERRFRLLGRAGDMLKLAGKRMSANDLTQRLLAIDGVRDAVVFRRPDDDGRLRPAALVVGPALAEREIAARLARMVDPVFVPRPLLRVDALPRNALGKLPRADLLAALRRRQARAKAGRGDRPCPV